ncbi:MAG: hypothetical protein JWL77_2505 [Chthonomonadaceae bacterium]|nr:hypothetical protein [Chthonomonadaceae bacterium]
MTEVEATVSATITIHSNAEGHFELPFPDRCVYCGQPKETELDWKIRGTGSVQEPGAKKPTTRSYGTDQRVPYCLEHARTQRRYETLTRRLQIAITLGIGLPAGLWAFWMIHRQGVVAYSVEAALLVWLGTTVLGWFCVDRLWRAFSKTAADQRDLLGIGARFSPDGRTLALTILNTEVADDFARRLSEKRRVAENLPRQPL